MFTEESVLSMADATLAKTKTGNPQAVDELENAVEAECKARVALIAIGEEWRKLRDDCTEPTDEERCLHAHLVREWQKAAELVHQMLQKPSG